MFIARYQPAGHEVSRGVIASSPRRIYDDLMGGCELPDFRRMPMLCPLPPPVEGPIFGKERRLRFHAPFQRSRFILEIRRALRHGTRAVY